ncbi:MAG: hypothetical protein OQK98_00930 [Gammaproteobacteria bacterium]|nr:hypothetical protein [Gammaproteobacteria bacterium]
MNMLSKITTLIIAACTLSHPLSAGQAVIENVKAECNHKRVCKFDVTISHADEGWTHFANGWQIFTTNGELLGHRALAHPHVKEQPFTRTIRNIKIPPSVDTVFLRANDSLHGASDRKYVLKLHFSEY